MQVPSQLGGHDRKIIDAIMKFVDSHGTYNYLEVGSYLGSSLVPHLRNPLCQKVLSIDKRSTEKIQDERMIDYAYTTSTKNMLDALARANVPTDTLVTIDGTIDDCQDQDLFDLVFIDAEHTNSAVLYDGKKCSKHMATKSIMMLHDDWIVYQAIEQLEHELQAAGQLVTKFKMTRGDITVLVFGDYIAEFQSHFQSQLASWTLFANKSAEKLQQVKSINLGT